ncbi:MAG: FAD:protein FMN transferase [Candidatus Saccharibacteria bacterium]
MRLQQTQTALGSVAVLTVVAATSHAADAMLGELWREISAFEARFSRFQPDSELTKLNQAAGHKVALSAEFMELLAAARRASDATEGLFNPFILPALQRAGYRGSWPNPSVVDAQLDYSDRAVRGMESLETGAGWARIPIDSALDFGGIGKGYLLDLLANLAEKRTTGYWFSLGGDIISGGFDDGHQPWRLGIQSAHENGEIIAQVENRSGHRLAVATSGVTKRRGPRHGGAWHHLVDPRSGQPSVSDVLTASVVSDRACQADVLASCLVVLGTSKARPLLNRHSLSALLQTAVTTPFSQGVHLIGDQIKLMTGPPESAS